ncbi:MAG: methyltransferase [marine bacterium B5-7]|nr:MAG: methyltransferase [marine bacterium B5-7]
MNDGEPLYSRVWRIVAQIPRGKVATYGQIASFIDRCGARQVGYALAATPPHVDIPWQRVINARGEVSTRTVSNGAETQRQRLEREGVAFDLKGRVDLDLFGWEGPDFKWLEKHGYRVFLD